jgi:glycosyltransferase involved in cell wall biosynthesis
MGSSARLPLLCFSHLRWDFVWQRPQHLMSRFARNRRVFFIEEPRFEETAGEAPDGAKLARYHPEDVDGVVVCQPVCRDPGPGGGPRLDAMYARLVADLVQEQGLQEHIAWFYTPMLLPAIEDLAPALVVYDAMDELSLFKGAPPDLVPRERRLLAIADLVFTGGVSLGKAKAAWHRHVYPEPSGVEVAHYQRALAPSTVVPPDLAALRPPRIGFFGVIDERADLELLARVADLRPDWSLVMIGPVVKIDPQELPRRPNIHYLGQKRYRDLPAYVKGLDVCMMPFALNDATRFISPTKTLEYMAAHKPIVSTPVADVVALYGEVVRIAQTPERFVAAIEQALAETPAEREARVARERSILSRRSWDAIAARMETRMEAALLARRTARRAPAAGRELVGVEAAG